MSYLGDTLTVGLILILLFGSIALYLYTRIQQTEQKVSLLESIVLDLKLTGEIQGFGDLPQDGGYHSHSSSSSSSLSSPSPKKSTSVTDESVSLDVMELARSSTPTKKEEELSYQPFPDSDATDGVDGAHSPVALRPFDPDSLDASDVPDSSVVGSVNPLEASEVMEEIAVSPLSEYDHMTLKEIQGLVRSRGLVSEKGAKKSALIEILKKADASAEVKPGSTSSSSFLDTSRSIQEDNE
jgi:hypothetical protein